jgi:hypothetical protein
MHIDRLVVQRQFGLMSVEGASPGARLRVMAMATSERRRGASRRSALSASVTDRSTGMTTCTNRCGGARLQPAFQGPPKTALHSAGS